MDATRHIYDEELLDASLDALRLIESETREEVLRAGLQLIVKVIFVSSSVLIHLLDCINARSSF